MTVYTTLPTDDLNLAVTVIDDPDLVVLNISPAAVSGGGGGGSGTVTSVGSGTGLTGGPITSSGTLNVDVGTGANQIVQLDASSKLPAVDGSNLTNLPGGGDVTLTGTQTLTNKTLTSPVLGGTTTSASGNIVLDPATQIVEIKGDGSSVEGQIKLNCHANSHGQTIKSQPHSANVTNTMLLPTGANSTLVSEATVNGLVDTHLNTATATSNQVLSWSGSDYDWVAQSGGSSTTINNNANNRVITGSDTADTLEGETGLTYDGAKMLVQGTAAGVNDAVLNLKTDNSGWNRPTLLAEDSNGKVFSQVGQLNTTAEYYQWNITLDPDNTHGRSGVTTYAGDYFVSFEKNYSTQSAIGMNMNVYGANDGFRIKVRDDFNNGGGNQYGDKSITLDCSEIIFANNSGDVYTFPNADGSANQVLQTDGNGQLSFATASGGGATDLNGLSDVTITSVQNNDLLMYNSTASKWQNTNLGLTVTPTLTGVSTMTESSVYTLTVSNHATYDDPAYSVEVYTGATRVVQNSDVTHNHDGTMTFTAPTAGTHEIRVRAQDFGDLQSEIATKALTTTAFAFNYRYFRMRDWTSTSATSVMVANFALYDAAGGDSGSGTKYPTNMTTNVLPTPFVASGTGSFSSAYDYYKAFDANVSQTFYWNLSGNNATNYLDIDLGAAVNIKSFNIRPGQSGYLFGGCSLYASSTGAFAGEEVLVTTVTGISATGSNIG